MKSLPDHQRRVLYSQLAQVLGAGGDPGRALGAVAGNAAVAPQARQAQRMVHRGLTVDQALLRSGLATPTEAALIRAYATTGHTESALRKLTADLDLRLRQRRRLRARLALPAAVLLLGCFLAPLPWALREGASAAAYLGRALTPVATALTAWTLLTLLARSRPLRERFGGGTQARFLATVGDLLQSGAAADHALRSAALVLPATRRGLAQRAALDLAGGSAVTETLAAHGLIESGADYPILRSAEYAGALPKALLQRARALDEKRLGRAETVAEWLPRLVYVAVLAYLASGIL